MHVIVGGKVGSEEDDRGSGEDRDEEDGEAKGFRGKAGFVGVGVGKVMVNGDAASARSAASLVSKMARRGRSFWVSLRISYYIPTRQLSFYLCACEVEERRVLVPLDSGS